MGWCSARSRHLPHRAPPPEAYAGHKDVNEAWIAGTRAVGAWSAAVADGLKELERPEDQREIWDERTSIMASAGRLPWAEAERLPGWGSKRQGKSREACQYQPLPSCQDICEGTVSWCSAAHQLLSYGVLRRLSEASARRPEGTQEFSRVSQYIAPPWDCLS